MFLTECNDVCIGGLGERLGYDGIKVALPAEITSGKCYLQIYCEHILALQARVQVATGQPVVLPLGIMTSDDTDKLTRKLLARHNYFGTS
jgi:UDP-sugar pyrophosphorylase